MRDHRPVHPIAGRWRVLVWALGVSLLVGCAGGGEAPELLPLQPAAVVVNETLRLDLSVRNPSGVGLTYTFTGPDLPGLSQVTHIAGTPSGGEFIWTPLASHVGTHQFVFSITSPNGGNSQSVLIQVDPAASAAPIFLRPGAGGTYDLARDPAVRFEIEVRDDDSTDVEIQMTGNPPEGSQLVNLGPKQARFEWIPGPEQIDKSERWTIQLQADDGDHAPTLHDYLIVLRSPPTEQCPGEPPAVSVLSPADNARVEQQGGYPVVISVTDDLGIRDAPLLYFSTTAPASESNPDLSGFDQTTFSESSGSWTAQIPSMELQASQERTVYYLVSVTDNDDPNGATCDHRTDTPLRRFIAVGSSEQPLALLCESCTSSAGCQSGVCATTSTGGVCLPPCGGGTTCTTGTCQATVTREGATVDACGDADTVCNGGEPSCQDDGFEPNDSFGGAAPLTQSATDATICPLNPDYFRIQVLSGADTDVTVTVSDYEWEVIDLDLELFDEDEVLIGRSAGIGESEIVQTCLPPSSQVVVKVFGYTVYDYGPYRLTVQQSSGTCCVNDEWEPDNTLLTAQPIGTDGWFEGRICPQDNDYRRFELTQASRVDVALLFESVGEGLADLDLKLYKADGSYIAGAFSYIEDEETLTVDLTDTGTYILRVYSVFSDASADYVGEILITQ
ncbi:MAG: PPC domain-containing protein [Bradymonadales bacterium]|nr:PPC domain-containing protein [Bradymonadales bacterium]